jgi:hypothetical protein
LTGLCVYEIDDPALRDDPSLDESTRLRNRIAELESLVRELRGKPHPRWAESTFRDGDPNEKWHSRATKCSPLQKRPAPQAGATAQQQPQEEGLRNGRAVHSLLSPIKTEPSAEAPNSHLYRFSPSPAPAMRYHTFQADVRSDSSSSFDGDPRSAAYPTNGNGGVAYHGNSTNGHYTNGSGNSTSAPSSYSDGGGAHNYPLSNSDDGNTTYNDQYSVSSSSPHSHYACTCRTNPALGIAFINLANTLQTSLNSIRQYSHHPQNSQCTLFRRIMDLNNSLHGNDSPGGIVPTSYDSGTTSDNEIMTPLSASSSHASFHATSPTAVSPQEWSHIATTLGSYFPGPDHHGVYNVNHVLS